MPSAQRVLLFDPEPPRYSFAELKEVRRYVLRRARSLPPGTERNQQRQVASSLRRLFCDDKWLEANLAEERQPARLKREMSPVG
jgi:hypothetical protein